MAAASESFLSGVWRASELAATELRTCSSGHPVLDQELPGAGWPQGSLTEILQAQPGLHEWRLLLPALRRVVTSGPLVLIGSPHLPNLPALSMMGIAAARLLLVEARTPAERLWSAEQVLRCRDLGALLVWLPQARPEQLRRLQMASQSSASATSQPLVFALRPLAAQHESSPAPLRISLRAARPDGVHHGLEVAILKRRGPALETPLQLHAALPAVVALRTSQAALSDASATSGLSVPGPRTGPMVVTDHAVDSTRPVGRSRSLESGRQPAHT
ncbi:MAG TPA: translesion DNA synthesis-associated protein ImuA [Castellaniella sp.]|nr:translesion DNA synthesis-associated protein ImuA [Castellaniella sp.]